LRDILALPQDTYIKVEVPIVYDTMTISYDEAVKIALETRIEIDQALDACQESYRLQRLAKNRLLPEINLMLDYTSFSRDELFTNVWTNRREAHWGIGFTTSTDFTNSGGEAAFEQSIIATSDAERNVEQVQDNVRLDVKRALRALRTANDKIKLQEEQIINAKKGFYLARIKFEHAMVKNFDVLQAEKCLKQSQTTFIMAVVEHKIGQYKLLASMGLLTDKPRLCR